MTAVALNEGDYFFLRCSSHACAKKVLARRRDFVGLTQFPVLALQCLDARSFGRRNAVSQPISTSWRLTNSHSVTGLQPIMEAMGSPHGG